MTSPRFNYTFALITLAALLPVAGAAAPAVPAFPGAEGAGAVTVGGRGGRVIPVTSLADSGPGTLRAALEAAGPRTVVFHVSGIITLESKLEVNNPFLTIAGQTAPGDGICVRGHTIELNASDIVVRAMHFRRGTHEDHGDALATSAAAGRIVVDRCVFGSERATYRSLPAPTDSDSDGMPDAWERRYQLDPHNPADGVADSDKDGYTNLEECLNGTNPREFIDYTLPANNVNTL